MPEISELTIHELISLLKTKESEFHQAWIRSAPYDGLKARRREIKDIQREIERRNPNWLA